MAASGAGTEKGQRVIDSAYNFTEGFTLPGPPNATLAATSGSFSRYLTDMFGLTPSDPTPPPGLSNVGESVNVAQPSIVFSNYVSSRVNTSGVPSNLNDILDKQLMQDFNAEFGSIGTTLGSAAGGFVIYPNKVNMNMMQNVYAK